MYLHKGFKEASRALARMVYYGAKDELMEPEINHHRQWCPLVVVTVAVAPC